MFDFVQRIRDRGQQKAQKIVSDADRYFALIHKAGGGKSLTAPETSEMVDLAERLDYPPEAVEADAKAVADHAALTAVAAKRAAAVADHADAAKASEQHRTQTDALAAVRAAEQDRLDGVARTHRETITEADRAATKAEAIRRANWRLFGQPDPAAVKQRAAVTASVRYVLHATAANADRWRGNSRVFWIGQMLAIAGPFDRFNGFDKLDFVAAPDQSPEEFAELRDAMSKAIKQPNSHNVRFLLTRPMAITHPGIIDDYATRDLVVWAEDWRASTPPSRYSFLRLPQQTPAEFAGLMRDITAKHADWKGQQPAPQNTLPAAPVLEVV